MNPSSPSNQNGAPKVSQFPPYSPSTSASPTPPRVTPRRHTKLKRFFATLVLILLLVGGTLYAKGVTLQDSLAWFNLGPNKVITTPIIRNDIKAYIIADIDDENDQPLYYLLRFYDANNQKISGQIAISTTSLAVSDSGVMSIQIIDDQHTATGTIYASALVSEDNVDPTDIPISPIHIGDPCILYLRVITCHASALDIDVSSFGTTTASARSTSTVATSTMATSTKGNAVKGISISIAPATLILADAPYRQPAPRSPTPPPPNNPPPAKKPAPAPKPKPPNKTPKNPNKPPQKKKNPPPVPPATPPSNPTPPTDPTTPTDPYTPPGDTPPGSNPSGNPDGPQPNPPAPSPNNHTPPGDPSTGHDPVPPAPNNYPTPPGANPDNSPPPGDYDPTYPAPGPGSQPGDYPPSEPPGDPSTGNDPVPMPPVDNSGDADYNNYGDNPNVPTDKPNNTPPAPIPKSKPNNPPPQGDNSKGTAGNNGGFDPSNNIFNGL